MLVQIRQTAVRLREIWPGGGCTYAYTLLNISVRSARSVSLPPCSFACTYLNDATPVNSEQSRPSPLRFIGVPQFLVLRSAADAQIWPFKSTNDLKNHFGSARLQPGTFSFVLSV